MVNVAILAGGTGSRLGGQDKGFIKIRGVAVIELLTEELKDFKKVVVCRNESQKSLYSPYSDVIVDEFEGMGPLAGIHAALKYFRNTVVVIAVDMPFVRRGVVEFLFNEAKRGNAVAIIPVWSDGKKEPLLACYTLEALDRIEKSLQKGEKKIMNALEHNRTGFYPIEKLKKYDKKLLSFINLNTLEDIRRVEEIC